MSKTVRTRIAPRNMGIGCLVAGACFLFDPFAGIFDFLPDAIGYLLIARAFYFLADLDDRLAEARRAALRLSLLGLARLFAMILTFAFVSASEQPVFILLANFSLGVVDLILLLPMWRHIGNGLTYLGSRAGATALLSARGSRSACERYVGVTSVFFIVREVLAVLPELTVLTHESGGAERSDGSLYLYVGSFRLLGSVVSLALGLAWLILTVLFVKKIRSDKPFMSALHARYQSEVAVRHELFAMRAVKASLASLVAAAVLSADLYIEGVSVLPDPLAAVCMILSLLSLRSYAEGKYRLPLLASALYGVFATVSWVMQIQYLGFNDLTDKTLLAARLSTVKTVQTLTAILFVVAFLLILRELYRLARRYTGLHPLHDDGTVLSTSAARTESIHHHIRRKLAWVGVFAVISALSALVLWTVAPTMGAIDPLVRPEAGGVFALMVYDFLREAYWMVDLALGVVFVILTVHASNEISEQMDYSYLMN